MRQTNEVGYVVSSREFLIFLDGLPTIKVNDMVESENGERGWVNSVLEDKVEVLMLDEGKISPNILFTRMDNRLGIAVGDFLLGRSINPVGVPIDGKGPLNRDSKAVLELDRTAPGIEARKFISEQFLTGITLVDSILPIGKGQRQLIMGDAHSGKTSFLINTIVNQKGANTICIYASIGKPAVAVRNLIDILKANNALSYTIVVAASSSEPAPLIFLTPKTALTIAEYFQRKGKNVLLILDDMGIHAKIYREISLLSGKPPGRESYPGDIFYTHAHLLERAGNFLFQFGGGSITALPVMELNMNDFTTLIPTNLMSMTDGHLLFKSSLRLQGQSPAVDIALSVTRVGRQTQTELSNLLSTRIRQVLSQAEDFETIARFSSELSAETQLILRRRDLIMEFLKQEPLSAIPKQIQTVLLSLPFTLLFKDKNRSYVEKNKQKIIQSFLNNPMLSAIAKSVDKIKTDIELISRLDKEQPQIEKICA